jgi:RimJ/RimL family protein N-acetyltransferase
MGSTGDVRLRDVTDADLSIFFEHQLDPEGSRMAAFPSRDRDAFMGHWAKILADQTVITKTVLFEGQVAGNVVSFEREGEREVGYWIGRDHWGKGIATRALSLFLGLDETRPLYAHVAKHNVASVRVLEKCGFRITGEDKDFSDVPGAQVEGFVLELGEQAGLIPQEGGAAIRPTGR